MSADRDLPEKHLVLTGDIVLDWHVARVARALGQSKAWNAADAARACRSFGGAALLRDLLSPMLRLRPLRAAGWSMHFPALPDVSSPEALSGFHHSYAMWLPASVTADAKDGPFVWRVNEFLGIDRCERPVAWRRALRQVAVSSPADACLVVIDDADLGFRDESALWPAAVRRATCGGWVLVKMAGEIAGGALWQHLVSKCAQRVVALMDVNDLRLREVQVSRDLSWERTAQDLLFELTCNPRVNALSHCRHVIVSLGTSGALVMSHERGGAQTCHLLFDPAASERMWEENQPGRLIGYTSCLASSVAFELMRRPERPDMCRAVQAGIAAMRDLHRGGYGEQAVDGPLQPPTFPVARIVDVLASSAAPLSRTDVPRSAQALGTPSTGAGTGVWSILDDKCSGPPDSSTGSIGPLPQVARRIVIEGPEPVLSGVPLGRFGKLLTADRREIEGYRSIRGLVSTYGDSGESMPLSIAVFGPPGSGKSFGVSQVAASISGLQVEPCTFNMSQFGSPAQIVAALHQVRDICLSGMMPLVFWDEFDAPADRQKLGWLRHFLSPMQDGAFQDGQVTHHIGRAIFVFAGGVYSTFEEFSTGLGTDEARAAKAPDFVSRLKGYVNIMGPNAIGGAAADPHYMVRRAMLLRSLLERKSPQLFEHGASRPRLRIDPGVLRALLHIHRYEHGVRSMESVIAMSTLAGRSAYERSCLPSRAQLDVHVDGAAFIGLVQQPDLEGELLDELAQAVYLVYCRQHSKRLRSDGSPRHSWDSLRPSEQEANRAPVRDYGHKLASIGYVMVPAREQESGQAFSADELRILGRLEHERWMTAKQAAGYRWGPVTNNDPSKELTNRLLLPWRKLSTDDQDANQAFARAMPQNLAIARYAFQLARPGTAEALLLRYGAEDDELRIAVSGHRVIADPDRLLVGVAEALDRISERYPGRTMHVYSPLAPGAVLMLTRCIHDRPNAKLVALLPLSEGDYELDFPCTEQTRVFHSLLSLSSRVVRLPYCAPRTEAYRQADNHMVDESDILLTVWDGKPSQGPAGTAESVERAMAQGMPVYQVWAGNRRPGTDEPTSLGDRQGALEVHEAKPRQPSRATA